jgi:hypothetical protein
MNPPTMEPTPPVNVPLADPELAPTKAPFS